MMRMLFTLAFAAMALCVSFPSGARADDESDETEIRITAPLEALSCDTVPPTVTVLGLPIDITGAQIVVQTDDDDDDEDCEEEDGEVDDDHVSVASHDEGEDGDDQGEDDDDQPAVCADLLLGRSVEVTLVSDLPPFFATKVKQGEDEGDVEIQAPIQALDPVLHTMTLLGLVIDISTATIEGSFDDDDDEHGIGTLTEADVILGQFVEVELDPSLLPLLVATEVEVKNAANECEVDVEGPDGADVDDVDEHGHEEETVQVDVEQVVPAAVGAKGKGKRTLHLQAHSNGRTLISGLATGRAKISVKRVKDGVTSVGRRSITVAPNTRSTAEIRLKGSKKK